MGIVCCTNSNRYQAESFSRKDFTGIKVGNITQDYFFEKQLGLGSYGEVKLGSSKKTGV